MKIIAYGHIGYLNHKDWIYPYRPVLGKHYWFYREPGDRILHKDQRPSEERQLPRPWDRVRVSQVLECENSENQVLLVYDQEPTAKPEFEALWTCIHHLICVQKTEKYFKSPHDDQYKRCWLATFSENMKQDAMTVEMVDRERWNTFCVGLSYSMLSIDMASKHHFGVVSSQDTSRY